MGHTLIHFRVPVVRIPYVQKIHISWISQMIHGRWPYAVRALMAQQVNQEACRAIVWGNWYLIRSGGSALCDAGVSKIRTSTSLSIPLFATKNTSPSININYNDTICYADLIEGQVSGAINVQYNGIVCCTMNLNE